MIGYRRKFVFVHVPKTAGQSVARALRPHTLFPHQQVIQRLGRHLGRSVKYDHYDLHIGHLGVADYQKTLTPEVYSEFFSFAFVRNPWDRILSAYTFTKLRSSSNFYDVATSGSLDDYICVLKEKGFKQQAEYLYDQNSQIGVDFIGRFESIDNDLAKVGKQLGVTLQLPHKNASKHAHYSESFSDWGRDAVAELARDDIREFGYSFV